MRTKEEVIINEIVKMGYDPENLPTLTSDRIKVKQRMFEKLSELVGTKHGYLELDIADCHTTFKLIGKCKCGTLKIIQNSSKLHKNKTCGEKKCQGDWQSEIRGGKKEKKYVRKERFYAEIGKVYGWLTVIDILEDGLKNSILARCKCGKNVVIKNISSLEKRKTCSDKECKSKQMAEFKMSKWEPTFPKTKICTKCNIERDIEDYYKCRPRESRDGRVAQCRFCKSEYKKSEEVKERNRERLAECRKDPIFNLDKSISTMMCRSLKGRKAGRAWESLVGYTLEDLVNHIESLFEPEMSWERFDEIHIDHIIPRSHFEYESEEDEQFKQCWALSNLKPRWATTRIAEKYGSDQIGNLNKGARFIG